MELVELKRRLAAIPTETFGLYPTPLHRLDRFSNAVGREVWIKRDDLISVGLGGNKVRKLGYLVADAKAAGANHLVTVGAQQSNHARCVAAVAAMMGLGCDLVLGGSPDAPIAGNLVLDTLLGATLHFPDTEYWPELENVSLKVADQLWAEGRHPYVMPIGGSTAIGALGYVNAYIELRDQLNATGLVPTAIVHATSSGGTQAGLVAASHALNDGIPVLGIGVAKSSSDLEAEVHRLVDKCLGLLGVASSEPSVTVVPGYLGEAYALPTVGAINALRLLARTEGIIVDPVYTAKALHAVIDGANDLLGDGPVVFWHTGGLPAIFSPTFVDALAT